MVWEPRFATAVADLAGHDLMCWCPLDRPCHADVLLELANGSRTHRPQGKPMTEGATPDPLLDLPRGGAS